MFSYTVNKKPKLEVIISKKYTELDVERLILFIDALIVSKEIKVIFKVDPSTKKQFKSNIEKMYLNTLFAYTIKEKVA